MLSRAAMESTEPPAATKKMAAARASKVEHVDLPAFQVQPPDVGGDDEQRRAHQEDDALPLLGQAAREQGQAGGQSQPFAHE